jgi:hypothetical protein
MVRTFSGQLLSHLIADLYQTVYFFMDNKNVDLAIRNFWHLHFFYLDDDAIYSNPALSILESISIQKHICRPQNGSVKFC